MTPVLKIYKINNAKWCKLRGNSVFLGYHKASSSRNKNFSLI